MAGQLEAREKEQHPRYCSVRTIFFRKQSLWAVTICHGNANVRHQHTYLVVTIMDGYGQYQLVELGCWSDIAVLFRGIDSCGSRTLNVVAVVFGPLCRPDAILVRPAVKFIPAHTQDILRFFKRYDAQWVSPSW